MNSAYDCLIVGGGPAGLTAAIYLARFHLDVIVADAGKGRAASIPLTRNHAGFPDGIAGADLLERMRRQAARYGAQYTAAEIEAIDRSPDAFVAIAQDQRLEARTVLIATGVFNRRPPGLSETLHDEMLALGLLRYCPICDGYEVTDKEVAILGTGERGFNEARFLRSFTSKLSMIATHGRHELTHRQNAILADMGVRLIEGGARLSIDDDGIVATCAAGRYIFDTVYPALGSDIHSELAAKLGARCSDEGCLLVDAHMRTSVPALYAAGDVVKGLDQISHAMGEGGVAATTIRNDLAEVRPLLRKPSS